MRVGVVPRASVTSSSVTSRFVFDVIKSVASARCDQVKLVEAQLRRQWLHFTPPPHPGEAMGNLHTLFLDCHHMLDQSNACLKNHGPFDVRVEWGATADGAVT